MPQWVLPKSLLTTKATPILHSVHRMKLLPNNDRFLTHLPLDKVAAISQTTFSNAFFNENLSISIQISLNLVPEGAIDHKSTLV